MDDKTKAQTLGKREVVDNLDQAFARLYVNSCAAIEYIPVGVLYAVPTQTTINSSRSGTGSMLSVGESVLRCAAAIEQTFGGIT